MRGIYFFGTSGDMSSATIEDQAIGDGVLTHTIFRAKFREVDSGPSVSYKMSLQVMGL